MPQVLKDAIVPVTKFSMGYNYTEVESLDKIWVPSYTELCAGTAMKETGVSYSDIFIDDASRIRFSSLNSTVASTYTTRSVTYGSSLNANPNRRYGIIATGAAGYNVYQNSENPFLIGFCL